MDKIKKEIVVISTLKICIDLFNKDINFAIIKYLLKSIFENFKHKSRLM